MEAYLIIFAIVFLIAAISCVVNAIAEKKDPDSVTAEVSGFIVHVFSVISGFMFFWGLYCIFC